MSLPFCFVVIFIAAAVFGCCFVCVFRAIVHVCVSDLFLRALTDRVASQTKLTLSLYLYSYIQMFVCNYIRVCVCVSCENLLSMHVWSSETEKCKQTDYQQASE